MTADAESGAVRELLVVLAVAGAGLVLATAAAFSPWHPTRNTRPPAGLVGLHNPNGADAQLTGAVIGVTDRSAG
ncbi:hypothetical protein MCAG_01899 [Micromonospora sp. ATCC 39149]|uniref:Uncharacterized protein n=1 Tax=Micromonospora carbonacea TaxID=47853 RepID=A0A7D6CEW4_9ACTN|nr:hypothetical protein [Micromonospora sp. ATCC 39149]EEP71572.1 hypothetical protein MCAG_01899 [Micromonospora sp. ATCC 39149]QLJ97828.1 hypothetical protein HZU44_24185 [Micromonospora carbonacea]